MTRTISRILVTGTSGQLGALVIEELLKKIHASHLIAAARDPKALMAFSRRGVETRLLDYTDQISIDAAFQGSNVCCWCPLMPLINVWCNTAT